MDEQTVAVTVIVMAGLVLTAVAWQLLAVARDRVRHAGGTSEELERDVADLRQRIAALERRNVKSSGAPPSPTGDQA